MWESSKILTQYKKLTYHHVQVIKEKMLFIQHRQMVITQMEILFILRIMYQIICLQLQMLLQIIWVIQGWVEIIIIIKMERKYLLIVPMLMAINYILYPLMLFKMDIMDALQEWLSIKRGHLAPVLELLSKKELWAHHQGWLYRKGLLTIGLIVQHQHIKLGTLSSTHLRMAN